MIGSRSPGSSPIRPLPTLTVTIELSAATSASHANRPVDPASDWLKISATRSTNRCWSSIRRCRRARSGAVGVDQERLRERRLGRERVQVGVEHEVDSLERFALGVGEHRAEYPEQRTGPLIQRRQEA